MDKQLALSKRNHGLDILRVLACYMVIQVHAGEFYYIGNGGMILEGCGPLWVDIYNSLCRTAVPLFVMLSGYFLLPVKEPMKDFFRRRTVRVVVPFIIWCALYAIYQYFRGQADLATTGLNILKIGINFGVEIGHLWYIYMLIGLYLFAPIISPWIANASRKSMQFYLCIWALSLFVPYIHLIFPEFLGECFWNHTPLLYYFSGFLGYMILAVYIKKYMSQRKKWHLPVSLLCIIAGYLVTAGGYATRLKTVILVPDLELTWGFETINVALMSFGLFLLIKDIRFKNPFSAPVKIITDISKLSYGIYLIHIMVLNFYFEIFNPVWDSVGLKLPCIAISTFITSYLLIKLLSLFPRSKYIIG
ncbi:acyltransferase [Coprobacter tertius]|uniref:Acyltransferase family protein n=1 Tax=Coprobacter tertius TaxID=2944915 RepID=A0ABT1MKS0_9BACT|nr:acyltransferase family protein [Coprobacter tertius]MCP9612461.1 acyltransferase family protein [Coprobacter tertius]